MKKYVLIGYPLEHSYSPQIHAIAYKLYNIVASYTLYEINPDNFEKEINHLKKENIDGFNITIPFKSKIIPFIDHLDKHAEIVGAVNTVKVVNGKWFGFNTDITGFIAPLKGQIDRFKNCLVLGSGGAARAVIFSILKYINPQNITIAARNLNKIEQLKNDFEKKINSANFNIINLNRVTEVLSSMDLLVNTTSLGMYPNINASPLPDIFKLKHKAIVYDLIYNPGKTKFLNDATKNQQACRIINGKQMLVSQALEAIKIWTGKSTSIESILPKIDF